MAVANSYTENCVHGFKYLPSDLGLRLRVFKEWHLLQQNPGQQCSHQKGRLLSLYEHFIQPTSLRDGLGVCVLKHTANAASRTGQICWSSKNPDLLASPLDVSLC